MTPAERIRDELAAIRLSLKTLAGFVGDMERELTFFDFAVWVTKQDRERQPFDKLKSDYFFEVCKGSVNAAQRMNVDIIKAAEEAK